MEILKTVNENKITLCLCGRLDTNTASSLENAVAELDLTNDIILDCSKLEYISSAGLRVLLLLQKKVNNVSSLTLVNVIDDVREVLDMTGFSSILNIK